MGSTTAEYIQRIMLPIYFLPPYYSSKKHMPPYVLLEPDSPPVQLGIKDQAQVFILGTQCEPGFTDARKGKGRNFIFPIKKHRIGLEGLIDSPKSLHLSSMIDTARFNLSGSDCGEITYAAMAMTSA